MEEIGRIFVSRKLALLALCETDFTGQGEVLFGGGERKETGDE